MQSHGADLRYQDGREDLVKLSSGAVVFETLTDCTLDELSTLTDEAATKTGDLYIRSVCFSPDGKLLATGAEDKQIRVGRHHSHLSLSFIVKV